jgi:hypothetical protein
VLADKRCAMVAAWHYNAAARWVLLPGASLQVELIRDIDLRPNPSLPIVVIQPTENQYSVVSLHITMPKAGGVLPLKPGLSVPLLFVDVEHIDVGYSVLALPADKIDLVFELPHDAPFTRAGNQPAF